MGHVHALFDFTTSGYIVHKNKILLVHHKKTGMWLQPGGHIELDEDPLQALYRELEEETGLVEADLIMIQVPSERPKFSGKSKLLPIPLDFNVHWFDKTHRHIDIAYLLQAKTTTVRLEESGAHGIAWYNHTQLKQLLARGHMYEYTYHYALYALNLVKNNFNQKSL